MNIFRTGRKQREADEKLRRENTNLRKQLIGLQREISAGMQRETGLNNEIDSITDFLKFLSAEVEDYDGLIIKHMEYLEKKYDEGH